jgi:hypothetical protein
VTCTRIGRITADERGSSAGWGGVDDRAGLRIKAQRDGSKKLPPVMQYLRQSALDPLYPRPTVTTLHGEKLPWDESDPFVATRLRMTR